MKCNFKYSFLILLTVFCLNASAQNKGKEYYLVDIPKGVVLSNNDNLLMDSTLANIKNAKTDSAKLFWIEHIVEESFNDDVWPLYNQLMYDIAVKNLNTNPNNKTFLKYKGAAINNQGYLLTVNENYVESIKKYHESIEISKIIGDTDALATNYNNIGAIFSRIGDYDNSFKNYTQALDLKLKTKEDGSIGLFYQNLAGTKMSLGDTIGAKKLYFKALEYRLKKNNKVDLSNVYQALANYYSRIKNIDSSRFFYHKSINLAYQAQYYQQYIASIILLSSTFSSEDIDSTFYYLNFAEKEIIRLQFDFGKDDIYRTYARLFYKQKNYSKGIVYAEKLFKLTQESGRVSDIESDAMLLSEYYTAIGNHQKALEYYKKSIEANEQIRSSEIKNTITRESLNSTFKEKEKIMKLEEEKRTEIARVRTRNQRIIIYISIACLIGVLVFFGFIYNRYQVTIRQKNLISQQQELLQKSNDELNHKNQLVTDSIEYSKHILKSIIPSEDILKTGFQEYFIYYKPKDIVSGDFYWAYNIDQNNTLIMVADCTGHGVPGAILSIVCSYALDWVVKRKKIYEPDRILEEFNLELAYRLNKKTQRNDNVKDGVELSVCSYNKETKTLKIASAGHKVVVTSNRNYTEYRGDAIPLADLKYSLGKTFSLHQIPLNEGDGFYLFSDGLPDQKGGEQGKKLFYKPFYEKLADISALTCEAQKLELESFVSNWKKDLEQYDDMLVVGFKV